VNLHHVILYRHENNIYIYIYIIYYIFIIFLYNINIYIYYIIQVKDKTDKIAEKKFQKFEQKVTKIEKRNDK